MSAALALAFSAGMVATLNPCGFAMLPAYLSYFVGVSEEDVTRPAAMRSALVVGGTVSFGFLVVFGLAGVGLSAGLQSLTEWIPWLAIVVGSAVLVLGFAMLAGFEPTVALPKTTRAGTGKGLRGVFTFGISYAIASLSCTLPVFLSVVATQLTSRSFAEGVAIFLVYGAGMSVVMLGTTVVVAIGKQSMVRRLRQSARYVGRVSGAILVLAGAFIVWFWATEISAGASALGASSAFRIVENVSQTLLNFVADNTVLVAGFFAGLVGLAVWTVLGSGRAVRGPRRDEVGAGARGD